MGINDPLKERKGNFVKILSHQSSTEFIEGKVNGESNVISAVISFGEIFLAADKSK